MTWDKDINEGLIAYKELHKSKSHCENCYAMNVSLFMKNNTVNSAGSKLNVKL